MSDPSVSTVGNSFARESAEQRNRCDVWVHNAFRKSKWYPLVDGRLPLATHFPGNQHPHLPNLVMLPTGNYNDIQYFGALHSDGSVSTLNLDTSNHNGLGLLLSKRFECHGVYQERRRGRKFFRLPRAKQSCSELFHAEQGRHRFTDS